MTVFVDGSGAVTVGEWWRKVVPSVEKGGEVERSSAVGEEGGAVSRGKWCRWWRQMVSLVEEGGAVNRAEWCSKWKRVMPSMEKSGSMAFEDWSIFYQTPFAEECCIWADRV